jgi:nucleoid DNA-binding protein
MYVPKTLATVIAEKADVDVDIAAAVMEAMCQHIIDSVKDDKEVAFTNFLKFKRSTRKARTFMPPKATKEIEIGERFAMTVKVMPKMKLILNPEDEALITKAAKPKPVAKKSSDDDIVEESGKPPKKKAAPKEKKLALPVDSDSDKEPDETAISDSDQEPEDSDSDEEVKEVKDVKEVKEVKEVKLPKKKLPKFMAKKKASTN